MMFHCMVKEILDQVGGLSSQNTELCTLLRNILQVLIRLVIWLFPCKTNQNYFILSAFLPHDDNQLFDSGNDADNWCSVHVRASRWFVWGSPWPGCHSLITNLYLESPERNFSSLQGQCAQFTDCNKNIWPHGLIILYISNWHDLYSLLLRIRIKQN